MILVVGFGLALALFIGWPGGEWELGWAALSALAAVFASCAALYISFRAERVKNAQRIEKIKIKLLCLKWDLVECSEGFRKAAVGMDFYMRHIDNEFMNDNACCRLQAGKEQAECALKIAKELDWSMFISYDAQNIEPIQKILLSMRHVESQLKGGGDVSKLYSGCRALHEEIAFVQRWML